MAPWYHPPLFTGEVSPQATEGAIRCGSPLHSPQFTSLSGLLVAGLSGCDGPEAEITRVSILQIPLPPSGPIPSSHSGDREQFFIEINIHLTSNSAFRKGLLEFVYSCRSAILRFPVCRETLCWTDRYSDGTMNTRAATRINRRYSSACSKRRRSDYLVERKGPVRRANRRCPLLRRGRPSRETSACALNRSAASIPPHSTFGRIPCVCPVTRSRKPSSTRLRATENLQRLMQRRRRHQCLPCCTSRTRL